MAVVIGLSSEAFELSESVGGAAGACPNLHLEVAREDRQPLLDGGLA